MLKVSNLTFSYTRGGWPVLRDLSIDIEPGGIYGLLGKNGVGKTTLLMMMSGLLTPDKGTVEMDGKDVRKRLPSVKSDIFFMPEELELPSIRVKDFVRVNAHFYPHFSHEEMSANLTAFAISDEMNIGGLSMGQKKKVVISFALACNSRLLLMDEPTNGLDIPSKEVFRRLLAGSVNEDRSIVISTHQIHDVELMLDHVMIMGEGKIIFDHTINEISRHLSFTITDRRELINEALYSRHTIGGMAVILTNKYEEETEIDLEMLFDMVLNNPGLLEYVFNSKKI